MPVSAVISDVITAATVGIVTVVVWKVISFYRQLGDYPPGPLPLPFLGNILTFVYRRDVHFDFILDDWGKKHGPVCTFWIGHNPQVCITDPHLTVEVLKTKAFSGRPAMLLADKLKSKPGSVDIAFGDAHPAVEANRKNSYSAVRKYIANPVLPDHIVRAVDQVVEQLVLKSKSAFSMSDYINDIILLAISTAVFGDKYNLEDEEYIKVKDAFITLTTTQSVFFMFEEVPLLNGFLDWWYKKFWQSTEYFKSHIAKKEEFHENTFDPETSNRDFTDALLWARRQAELEGDHESVKYLNKWNIMNSMRNLFFAGADTTRVSLSWWFLCLSVYPDMQKKIREEIDSIFSEDDIPTLEYRSQCHYLQSFTMEVLRIYPAGRYAAHKAVKDHMVAGHTIKKGTPILVSLSCGNMNDEVWKDPHIFNPDRFLDDQGKFLPRPNPFFLTFSQGTRSCIGEKLALANIFLITCRIMQMTRGYVFQATPKPRDVKKLFVPDLTNLIYGPLPFRLSLERVQ